MTVLVTGATGYIGSHLVRALRGRAATVRILVRDAARARDLEALGCEVRLADFAAPDPAVFAQATQGIDVVFHLVSAMYGSAERFEQVDVRGTERMLEESVRAGVHRFVYVSTLASYPLARLADGAIVDERSPFDDSGLLGPYPRAKVRAERAVAAANGRGGLESVIVRLGQVCGAGYNVFLPHVCQRVGTKRVVLFGSGAVPLPLVHIDNAVEAVLRAAEVPGIAGESFNIVDDDRVTQREYLTLLRATTGGVPRVVRLPRLAYYAIGALSELAAAARRKEPTTNRYRVRTRLRHVGWDCSKAKRLLAWSPRAPLRAGLTEAFETYAA
ncbi:MAG: NAD-dependent epimerase/dehydratase family protein, partial [Steroidobacteraceae bacterium]